MADYRRYTIPTLRPLPHTPNVRYLQGWAVGDGGSGTDEVCTEQTAVTCRHRRCHRVVSWLPLTMLNSFSLKIHTSFM